MSVSSAPLTRPALQLAGALLLGCYGYDGSGATLVVLGVGLALLRPKPFLGCALLLCYALASCAVGFRVERYEKERLALREHFSGTLRCHGEFVVTTSPTERRARERENDEATSLWTGRAETLECENAEVRLPLLVRLSGGPRDLGRGDRVLLTADLGIVELLRNPALQSPLPSAARRGALLSGAVLDAELVERGRGLLRLVDAFRAHVRTRIRRTFQPEVIPLARALVLGENDLEEEEAKAFSASGLSHLLAVSGTHLVIAVGSVSTFLRGIGLRLRKLSCRYDVPAALAPLVGALALLYADFSGGSGSAFRAAFMLTLVSAARAVGRRLTGESALAGSVVVALCVDPLYAFDLSFLLSVAATSGLLVLGRRLTRLLPALLSRGLLGHVSESLCATLSATLACAPVLAFLTPELSLIALLANVVAAPFGEVFALPACLLHGIVAASPDLERGLAFLGGGALGVVRAVALWSASVRSGRVPLPYPSETLLCSSVLALLLLNQLATAKGHELLARLFAPKNRLPLFVGSVAAGAGLLGVFLFARASPSRSLEVTFLDVGQGDAAALHFPGGELALIDGGGSAYGVPDTAERVLLPFLRKQGKSIVDLMILSHAHPDHYKGLVGVARKVAVRELWHPEGAIEPFGEYRELLELVKKSGGRILGPADLCGERVGTTGAHGVGHRKVFGVDVDILAPCPGPEGWDLNDESLVLRVHTPRGRYLFTGDAERLGEERLLERARPYLAAEVLKVGHHGSATSTSPSFVEAVHPQIAVISCGIRNRFSHPRVETLETLAAAQVETRRLDLEGGFTL